MSNTIFHSEDEWKNRNRNDSVVYLLEKIERDRIKQVKEALANFFQQYSTVLELEPLK